MPSEGTAQYSIKGLSKYSSGEQISGTFSTNFDANTFTGSLSSTDLSYSLSGTVSGSAFDGTASVSTTGTDTTTVSGTTNGHFFGDNAQHVAGYAEFSSDKEKISRSAEPSPDSLLIHFTRNRLSVHGV